MSLQSTIRAAAGAVTNSAAPDAGTAEPAETAPQATPGVIADEAGAPAASAAATSGVPAIPPALSEPAVADSGLNAGDERARISAILSAPEAASNKALANHLAFKTDTSAQDAIAAMAAAGTGGENALDARMNADGNADLGTGAAGKTSGSHNDNLLNFAQAQKAARTASRS